MARMADLRRRDVLAGAALGAGALGLAACATAPPSSASPSPAGGRLFAQPDLDFSASFALGEAAYGASEVGEVLAAVERINAAGASYQTFVDGFTALARRVSAEGDAALRAGRRISARGASLRAAHYHKQALYFVLGTSHAADEAGVYRAMQTQWHRAAGLFDPPLERVEIPYEGSTLPGYFLTPDRSGRARATVILNNGSDAQNVDLWAYGGAAALGRGYNALIFEGPGQGAMLFERQVPFRPDWEQVVMPVVDFLVARRDVDARRLAIIGWSMGGGMAARAAAFEPRLAAVCCDPGVGDVWAAFPPALQAMAGAGDKDVVNGLWRTRVLPDLSPVERFTLMKRCAMFHRGFHDEARAGRISGDFHDFAQTVQRFRYIDSIDRITAPVLVTRYELEHTNPAGTAQQVYDRLRARKTLVTFTAAEGAGAHDAPFAPQRRNATIFDWLDDTLKP
jgi:alpha/beta hydrolase family protein